MCKINGFSSALGTKAVFLNRFNYCVLIIKHTNYTAGAYERGKTPNQGRGYLSPCETFGVSVNIPSRINLSLNAYVCACVGDRKNTQNNSIYFTDFSLQMRMSFLSGSFSCFLSEESDHLPSQQHCIMRQEWIQSLSFIWQTAQVQTEME